jgi:hypothetical protein
MDDREVLMRGSIAGVLGDAVRQAADFEAAVSRVQAVLDIPHEEALARVRAQLAKLEQQP